VLDEAAFIARLEAANADEFAEMLRSPTRDQEKALRTYFGEERYQRLHSNAIRTGLRGALAEPEGNIVVIPGIMGSELSSLSRSGSSSQVWVKVMQIMDGALSLLQLGDDGRTGLDKTIDVRPTGIMKRHYGELLLALSERWRVRAFWFDWRKDMRLSAADLETQIRGWFGDDAPVHLVAHSMGGLVARTFIKNYGARWKAMWDEDGDGRRGGRLIMLGTPNHGSFAIPQVLTGIDGLVKKLALLDLAHSRRDLIDIFASFPGLYQMLPSPLFNQDYRRLYEAGTYGDLKISQSLLNAAANQHHSIADVIDPERMIYVAGANRPTFSGIRAGSELGSREAYEVTMEGDGRVTHLLGRLESKNNGTIPTYYVDAAHGELSVNEEVLSALKELLPHGETSVLPPTPHASRTASSASTTNRDGRSAASEGDLLALIEQADADDEAALRNAIRPRSATSAGYRDGRPSFYVSSQERLVEEILTRGLLSCSDDEATPPPDAPFAPTPVKVSLICAGIEEVGDDETQQPPDAIAVGHYIGVAPLAAELALDHAISRHLPGSGKDGQGVLSQLVARGIIQGARGQLFLLPDPRTAGRQPERLIAVVGMGYPGRFGVPELTLTARELCWALGRLGKQHLATVLIGAGNGNISTRATIDAWIRGIKHAVTGATDNASRLRQVTFIEEDPRKLREADEAITAAKAALGRRNRLAIDYTPLDQVLTTEEKASLRKKARKLARVEVERALAVDSGQAMPPPTRVTLALEGGQYRFGAITESAALPERAVPLDQRLVHQANDELAAEWRPARQQERGRLMERLLVPKDLRDHLAGNAPLVMVLDATTARIHWEMVAQSRVDGDSAQEPPSTETLATSFLGTSRGFTRQLITPFAPAPQPPPPSLRILRVLVVADPAGDAHLPGAEEEGVEVADIFETFNEVWADSTESRVEVVRLFGPSEATRTQVLRHLLLRSYDVLHYAGHCMYDEDDPARQGWVFSIADPPDLLSPHELNRIDRIPKFVFSNACESGVTPDRSEERTVGLAPGFAEAFFQRGVANFVCTAWPVDDGAARTLALKLYSSLLGLKDDPERPGRYRQARPRPMWEAMQEARLAIFDSVGGARTWGAYQHYGDPYFRLFDPATIEASGVDDNARATTNGSARREEGAGDLSADLQGKTTSAGRTKTAEGSRASRSASR
jgi:pimeloyl-ACP methyl ester carboxylesterase